MRFSLKSIVLAAAAMLSLSAFAQDGNLANPANANCAASGACAMHGGWAKGQRWTPEQRQQRFDQQIAAQAKALNITAAQRTQWDAYVQARKDMYAGMPMMQGADPQAMRAQMQAMTPDQRMQMRAQRMSVMSQNLQKLSDATKNLRGALNAKQLAQFDKMADHHHGHWGAERGEHRRMRIDGKNPAAMPAAATQP